MSTAFTDKSIKASIEKQKLAQQMQKSRGGRTLLVRQDVFTTLTFAITHFLLLSHSGKGQRWVWPVRDASQAAGQSHQQCRRCNTQMSQSWTTIHSFFLLKFLSLVFITMSHLAVQRLHPDHPTLISETNVHKSYENTVLRFNPAWPL